MNKIKDMLLISKAKKSLGEEMYNSIKTEFISTFDRLCADFDESSDINCKKVVKELGLLKNHIWVQSLFKTLGPTMVGVALWRQDVYGLQHTIIACAVGVVMTVLASIGKKKSSKEFEIRQSEFISYIDSKMNKSSGKIKSSISDVNDTYQDNYILSCKSACDELIDGQKDLYL